MKSLAKMDIVEINGTKGILVSDLAKYLEVNPRSILNQIELMNIRIYSPFNKYQERNEEPTLMSIIPYESLGELMMSSRRNSKRRSVS